jgi:AraC family transcriptional regulator, ethanolamine operon transcriptional activator
MIGSDTRFSLTCASLSERSQFPDTDFQADFRPLGGGRHGSRLSWVDSGEMRILAVHDHGGIQMRGAVNDDALVAVFMWGQDTRLNGLRQDVPRLLLLGPGTELTATQPGEYHYLRVGVRGTALQELAERPSSARSVQPWLRGGVFEPRCSAAAEWRLQRSLLRALRFAGPATARIGPPEPAVTLAADDVLHDLLAALGTTDDSDTSEPLPAVSRRRLVARALDVLHATPDEPASIVSVCDALGVTERTLQRAFHDCLGMSLRAYERERRLRAAHGALLAEGHRRSITDIAMSFGFWHLGRFSGAYAALFGCVPTETRRRVWGEVEDEALAPVTPPAEAEPRATRDRGAARVTPW